LRHQTYRRLIAEPRPTNDDRAVRGGARRASARSVVRMRDAPPTQQPLASAGGFFAFRGTMSPVPRGTRRSLTARNQQALLTARATSCGPRPSRVGAFCVSGIMSSVMAGLSTGTPPFLCTITSADPPCLSARPGVTQTLAGVFMRRGDRSRPNRETRFVSHQRHDPSKPIRLFCIAIVPYSTTSFPQVDGATGSP
jgi:hypothetical protein